MCVAFSAKHVIVYQYSFYWRWGCRYRPGQGIVARFTAVFTAPVAGTTQEFGIGDATNGFFFGSNSSGVFGLFRRSSGDHELYTLTITAAATSGGDVTLTLDDVEYIITIPATVKLSETASVIAATTFQAWYVSSNGTTIVFVCHDSHAHGGVFSFSGGTTGATATFNGGPVVTGVAPTDTFVAQSEWNIDTCDGTNDANNPSGMNLDVTNGNVYQIQFQWLGFGAIVFSLENTFTGKFMAVHRIQYANTAATTSIVRPSNHITGKVTTGAGVLETVVLQTPSIAAFTEGTPVFLGPVKSARSLPQTLVADSERPLLSIRAALTYNNKFNYVPVIPYMAMGTDSTSGTDLTVYRLYKGGYTVSDSDDGYVNHDLTRSVVQVMVDPATDGWVPGSDAVLLAIWTGTDRSSESLDLSNLGIVLHAGNTLTITAECTGASSVTGTLIWREDF
jgi:hypothetical protein